MLDLALKMHECEQQSAEWSRVKGAFVGLCDGIEFPPLELTQRITMIVRDYKSPFNAESIVMQTLVPESLIFTLFRATFAPHKSRR